MEDSPSRNITAWTEPDKNNLINILVILDIIMFIRRSPCYLLYLSTDILGNGPLSVLKKTTEKWQEMKAKCGNCPKMMFMKRDMTLSQSVVEKYKENRTRTCRQCYQKKRENLNYIL